MTRKAARTKLESNGYKIAGSMQGGYIATKGQRSYKAETLNGLINKIF
jgi:hypothetical protein